MQILEVKKLDYLLFFKRVNTKIAFKCKIILNLKTAKKRILNDNPKNISRFLCKNSSKVLKKR